MFETKRKAFTIDDSVNTLFIYNVVILLLFLGVAKIPVYIYYTMTYNGKN